MHCKSYDSYGLPSLLPSRSFSPFWPFGVSQGVTECPFMPVVVDDAGCTGSLADYRAVEDGVEVLNVTA